jgi:hypothetical protein
MKAHPHREEEHERTTATPADSPPRCPLCDGTIIPLRDGYRCVRCRYGFCFSCEAAAPTAID